ncbi:ABC-type transport auxiliary lipoprotein family protein [Roseomonas sp. OT10]|uniref:ABC-type transport auxiliary lipoprotein family protein n=1 Tax=Roseomonas cutis TaxID=2897332 RepID=UPI001E525EF4|nr:ABC-type transport auxiliary lipoprotein family protein [Roseomonas sp. OT10]UFN50987.1 ABC-type transport auxiliary lipoprotein family protein [Roseomonas sp. OT10]
MTAAPIRVPGRRAFLSAAALALPGLAACSALQTPYVEPLRFTLLPLRQGPARAGFGRRSVLVRLARAAPGLEGRLLRSINPDGTVSVEYYAEWTAPPAEGMEEALRRWLVASGLFSAVLAPGTRGAADFTLEVELTALHADLGRGEARAAISAVLLRESTFGGNTIVVAQSVNTGTALLPPERPLLPAPQAAAMVEALGRALGGLELVLAQHLR